jgi:oxygen-dependent protoporphyrinogen oxidase
MSGLARSAARSLGDRFRAGFPVNAVRSGESGWLVEGPETLIADSVVVATGPESAAALVDRGLATHLRRSVGAPVVVVGLGGRGPSPLPPGFGALIDRGEGMASRGMLFESSYAPGRAPIGHWLVKLIAGGATNPDLADWDDDRLLDRVEEEVARVVGGELDTSFRAIIRHLPGIPQYNLGHGHWLTQLDQMVSERPGLHLAGWGYRGVGLADLATDAARIRRRVSPDLA